MDRRFRPYRSIFPSRLKPIKGLRNVYRVGLVRGSSVEAVIRDCRYLAEAESRKSHQDVVIQFKWAGVAVRVRKDSNYRSLYKDWQRAVNGAFVHREVGPIATGLC